MNILNVKYSGEDIILTTEQTEIFKCKRCGAMFDNKPQAEAHAEEEFKKIFPESSSTAIKKSEPEVSKITKPELKTKITRADKIAAKIDKAGAKMRGAVEGYNTVGQAIRRNYDFDAVFDHALSMNGSIGSVNLWGNKKKSAE